MNSQPVQPLRIQKGTPSSSPNKMSATNGNPLSELSPTGIRRNSPSFTKGNKGSIFKGDSSPFDSSPSNTNTTSSPRLFWQGRDPVSPGRLSTENRSPFERDNNPLPSKRSSIENLKRASRVKNSSMFAREQKNEYDPTHVTPLERPLATGRPLSMQVQGNAFGGRGLQGMRKEQEASPDAFMKSTTFNPSDSINSDTVAPLSPSKSQMSPTKSSLSKKMGMHVRNMGFDPENGIWSEDEDSPGKKLPEGRGLHRHAKSVTFDQAPPQINEYIMATPDPSSIASGSREGSYDSVDEYEDGMDYAQESTIDHDDSFDASLEDTEKTPVVLPEDWRFMSPDNANDGLAKHEDDPFNGEYGSPEPTAQPGSNAEYRPHQSSVNSVDSNGQPRPLPPLPEISSPMTAAYEVNKRLSGTLERVSSAQRTLPTPPRPASISKSDLRGMGGVSMNLEDRLRLMMLQDQNQDKSEAEMQRERRMRRANSKDRSSIRPELGINLQQKGTEESANLDDSLASPPRISRESILAKIRSQKEFDYGDGYDESSPMASSSPERPQPLDPDVPIPSTESNASTGSPGPVFVKEEQEEADLYSIPDLYSKCLQSDNDEEEDDASQYSQPSLVHLSSMPGGFESEGDGQDTPRGNSPERSEPTEKPMDSQGMSLPAFATFGVENSFDLGLSSYMTPSPPLGQVVSKIHPTLAPSVDKELPPRPITPELQMQSSGMSAESESSEEDPGTPDSVIRRPIWDDEVPDSPSVEEPVATVKAPGSRLKTRPSISPADAETMAATRRQVSDQYPVPPIPEKHKNRPSFGSIDKPLGSSNTSGEYEDNHAEVNKRVSSLVQLEIPRNDSDEGLGLGLDKEFDRVIEGQKVAFELSLSNLNTPFYGRFPSELPYPQERDDRTSQPLILPGTEQSGGQGFLPQRNRIIANRSPMRQRGYLMRQNTKVVVASNHHDEPAGPQSHENDENAPDPTASPRKTSQQTWTTEPWNGRSRRKSIKMTSGSPRKRAADGPAPPLPGQSSNVKQGLECVDEDEARENEEVDPEDAERGRLFVKVVGVKDLDLPLPRNERSYFALTLDNGLHCVTTAWLELGKIAPIGQEFELVVLNDLEFQLTLQMKLEEPKPQVTDSPSKAPGSPKKQSAFSRVFGSPKKRKELEAQQIESQRSRSPVRSQQQSLYEMVQGLVARDGSFARAYVALSDHEKRAFGRPYTVDITCFNEWAMEESTNGSSRSKKGMGLQRRPPYKVGNLELQLLYIPKPKGARDEDMPKSMNACIRELREAEVSATAQWEGHLSQQGGDCPYWRRRFFRLNGPRLTAYHEATLQPRANINLAKAAKLIDDKSALTKKETSTKGGGRRKSAFGEEEEGYMFVEEGFRIRFANGEVIDFYADTAADKDAWMKVLSETVGKGGPSGSVKGWAQVVLKHEEAVAAKKAARSLIPEPSPRKSSKQNSHDQSHNQPLKKSQGQGPPMMRGALSPPSNLSPEKQHPQRPGHSRRESHQGQPTATPMKDRSAVRREKARSMVF